MLVKGKCVFPASRSFPSKFGEGNVVSALFSFPEGTPGAEYKEEYDEWQRSVYAQEGSPKGNFLRSLQRDQIVQFYIGDKGNISIAQDTPVQVAGPTQANPSETQSTHKRPLMTPDELAFAALVGVAEAVGVYEHAYETLLERYADDDRFDNDLISRLATTATLHGIRNYKKVQNTDLSDSEQRVAALVDGDDFDVSEYINVIAAESDHFDEPGEVAEAYRAMNIASAAIDVTSKESVVNYARIAWRYGDLLAGGKTDKEAARITTGEFGLPAPPEDPIF